MYLNCHTYFSLKYGTLSPKELVEEAIDKGAEVLALTDINNTSAAFEFHKLCIENKIKPIVGIEFRNADELLYIGLAKNNEGFRELNAYLSFYNASKKPLPPIPPEFHHAYIIYPLGKKEVEALKENEFIGIKISELNRFSLSELSKRQDKLVMLHPVTFKDKKGYSTHRLLRAIDKNTLLSKISSEEQANETEQMLHIDKLFGVYGRFQQMIRTTMRVLESCTIEFDKEIKNKKSFSREASDDKVLLEMHAMQGLRERYGEKNKIARDRVIKELEIVDRLGFNAYFLITRDIIGYAMNRNFAYVGRGSGANSIIAYCLRITDVDPIELDLYFERFLNPHRTSPPDFDIDFSWKDRDEITEYILTQYGSKHTALLATYNTFKGRSIIRELGKVFGLPKHEIDILAKERDPKLKDKDHIAKMIMKFGAHLQNFPNYLGIHAGGILISENPLHYYTATDLPPKGFSITHFDMFTAEDMGFHKYDILSQRGLGHIKDAISIVKENRGDIVNIDIEKAKKDPKINEHLKEARTIGCFYIESPGMRMLLKKLKCADYLTLVAASSIIRPGVAQSGMMAQYIRNFHEPEKTKYLHPKMEELLKDTYGVMVYQEDVIKVAHHFAGLDLGEADILRRAMSGKYKGYAGFNLIKDRFFESCTQEGHSEALSQEVWRQIESFGGYSFSKAHSASFAVESYQSLYLKTYYPLEFYVAVINNFGGFYNTEFYVHAARMSGGDIQAPCVNQGEQMTTVRGKKVYMGFVHIKDLEGKIAEVIALDRKHNGPYTDLINFTKRIPIGLQQLNILIRSGAFRFTGKSKKVLLMEAALYFAKSKVKVQMPEIFTTEYKEIHLPTLANFCHEDAFDELELFGFPLCFPFDLLPEKYKTGITHEQMMQHVGKKMSMVGYFVHSKDLYTSRREPMSFMHFIDMKGNTIDSIHFPPSLRRYPLRGKSFYLLKGKITEEFGYPCIEVDYMEKLPMVIKEVVYKDESLKQKVESV